MLHQFRNEEMGHEVLSEEIQLIVIDDLKNLINNIEIAVQFLIKRSTSVGTTA